MPQNGLVIIIFIAVGHKMLVNFSSERNFAAEEGARAASVSSGDFCTSCLASSHDGDTEIVIKLQSKLLHCRLDRVCECSLCWNLDGVQTS